MIGKTLLLLLTLFSVGFYSTTAHAKCFGEASACEEVYISKKGGCQVVVNDGRKLVKVENANNKGKKTAGPVTRVYGGSYEPILQWSGDCYKGGMYRNYIATYENENIDQAEEVAGVAEEEDILRELNTIDSEGSANSVFFHVKDYLVVYLRVRLPSGFVTHPKIGKSSEPIEYPIGPYDHIKYCWSSQKTPKTCLPYWTLRSAQTKTFD